MFLLAQTFKRRDKGEADIDMTALIHLLIQFQSTSKFPQSQREQADKWLAQVCIDQVLRVSCVHMHVCAVSLMFQHRF